MKAYRRDLADYPDGYFKTKKPDDQAAKDQADKEQAEKDKAAENKQ